MQRHALTAKTLSTFLALGVLALPATAAPTADLAERIAACRKIANEADRLACYDSVARDASADRPGAEPERPTSEAAGPGQKDTERATGSKQTTDAAATDARERAPGRKEAATRAPTDRAALVAAFGADNLPPDKRPPMPRKKLDELRAKVAKVREDPYGKAIITLDNGQVWRQTQPERIRFRTGEDADEVIIQRRSVLEGYLLEQPRSNRRIDVERVK